MSQIKDKGNVLYQLFLLILSLYVLTVLVLEMFVVSNPETRQVLQYVDLAVCLLFLIDFCYNVVTAPNKFAYLKWGWIDLVASIPMIDPLRWGRLSRVVRIIRVLRTVKSTKVLVQALQRSKMQSFTLIVVLLTFLSYTICASMILEYERAAGGSLDTAEEALWWALLNIMNSKITITQAVSFEGQVITMILNKVGLLLFAYFNAIAVAWLIQNKSQPSSITSD